MLDTIVVNQLKQSSKAILTFKDKFNNIVQSQAFVGKNGMTLNKVEGDGKTPKGIFELGIIFGIHTKETININRNIEYVRINPNLYWIDDINSKYYNKLVDITKVNKDWSTAEHLMRYPIQYEYAIEIKTNKDNIPGKR